MCKSTMRYTSVEHKSKKSCEALCFAQVVSLHASALHFTLCPLTRLSCRIQCFDTWYDLDEFISLFSLSYYDWEFVYFKHSRQCLIIFPNTLKFTKNLSSCYLKIWSRWSYRFDILLQKIVPLCKWIRDWLLKKLTDQVDIAKWHLTKKVSLNSKEQGNCLVSWWTQSSHWRNTGHLWFSSWFCPWPHLSAKRWPNSNHSRVTKTWNPL